MQYDDADGVEVIGEPGSSSFRAAHQQHPHPQRQPQSQPQPQQQQQQQQQQSQPRQTLTSRPGPLNPIPKQEESPRAVEGRANGTVNGSSSIHSVINGTTPSDKNTRVIIIDGDRLVVSPLRPIHLDNRRIREITQHPIRRQVQIRRGVELTPQDIDSIYSTRDGGGARWLSCHIKRPASSKPSHVSAAPTTMASSRTASS